MPVEVRILGPVGVDGGVDTIDVPKERALLALLALSVGRSVPVHRLIDGVWGEQPPPTAEKTLQGLVFRLRRVLGPDVVVTDGAGYALHVDALAVDAHRFQALVEHGRLALEGRDPVTARQAFTEALALWRGEPLLDLADGSVRAGQQARLAELHLLAVEGRVEAELALGHHDEVIPELERLVAEHPLSERLWAHLMLALYRAARQADALRTYQRLRSRLGAELGIEPTPALRRLEARILRQDPQLDLDPPVPPDNLPAPVSSFVGRDDDLSRAEQALADHRLVTLVGTAGVGKTRLASELARAVRRRFPDGTWWVDLLPATADVVAERIAAVIGLRPGLGRSHADALAAYLRHRELLIVLDNCEHVVGAVGELARQVLSTAEGVRVVVTSRVPLAVIGEHLVRVGPLAVPPASFEGDARLASFDAIRLFVERCGDRGCRPVAESDLGAVARVCRLVDGVPLAIELAAARAAYLQPSAIADRLAASLDILSARTAADPRHRSLVAALDWSYGLLGPVEQRVLDRLSVFPGDFDLQAAEAVAGADGVDPDAVVDAIGRLVDASLVAVTAAPPRRYRLLETVRSYGRGHLDRESEDRTIDRFVDHFCALARRADTEIGAETESRENAAWRHRLVADVLNLRAAVAWSLEREDRSRTLEFARTFGWLEFMVGNLDAAQATLERMLEGSGRAPRVLRAWALMRLAVIALDRADLARSREAADDAMALVTPEEEPGGVGWTLFVLGVLAQIEHGGEVDQALALFERASTLQAAAGLPVSQARIDVLICRQLALGDRIDDEMLHRLDEADRVLRAARDPDFASVDTARLELADAVDDVDGIEAASRAMLRHGAEGERIPSEAYIGLAHARRLRGDLEGAQRELLRALQIQVERNDLLYAGVSLQSLSALAARCDRPVEAARLWGAGTLYSPEWPLIRRKNGAVLGRVRATLGDRFDEEAAVGRAMSLDELQTLAAFDLGDGHAPPEERSPR